MIFQCECCRCDVEVSDEYASVLVVENKKTYPIKVHHSFILCDKCYRKIKKFMERK